jgi:hypothetical protein
MRATTTLILHLEQHTKMLLNLIREMRATLLLMESRSQLARQPHLMVFHHCRHHYHVRCLRLHRTKLRVVNPQTRLVQRRRFRLCHLQPAMQQATRMKMMTTMIHSNIQRHQTQHLQRRELCLLHLTPSRLRRKVARRHLCLRLFPQYPSIRPRNRQTRMISTPHHSRGSLMIGRRLHRLKHHSINMRLHLSRPWTELRRHLLHRNGLHLRFHLWTALPHRRRRR